MNGRIVRKLDGKEAEVIGKVAETMSQLSALPFRSSTTCFDTASLPPISIGSYVERLWKYTECSIECFVICLTYIQRICKTHKMSVGLLNVHTLTFTSLVVAIKFQDDRFLRNSHYARIGGVTVENLCSLEISFLKLLDWQAGIKLEDFDRCCDLLFCEDRGRRLVTWLSAPEIHGPGCASCHTEVDELVENELDGETPKYILTPDKKPFYKLSSEEVASTSTVCSLADVDH